MEVGYSHISVLCPLPLLLLLLSLSVDVAGVSWLSLRSYLRYNPVLLLEQEAVSHYRLQHRR